MLLCMCVCVYVWRLKGINNKSPPYISNINEDIQELQEGEGNVLSNGHCDPVTGRHCCFINKSWPSPSPLRQTSLVWVFFSAGYKFSLLLSFHTDLSHTRPWLPGQRFISTSGSGQLCCLDTSSTLTIATIISSPEIHMVLSGSPGIGWWGEGVGRGKYLLF